MRIGRSSQRTVTDPGRMARPGESYLDAGTAFQIGRRVDQRLTVGAASSRGWEQRTPDWQQYHAAYHTSAPALGKLAARIQPKKLVLYHELPMGEPPDQAIREIREFYAGEVIYGADLQVVR